MSLLFFARATAFVGAVVVGLCAGATPARAATFVVNSTGDFQTPDCGTEGAPCTLRGAITSANANKDFDAIVFDPVVFASKQTIAVTNYGDWGAYSNGLPEIFSNLSITGPDTPGAGLTIRATNSQKDYLLKILGSTVALSNLSFTGALNAVNTSGSNTTVTNCTFFGNARAIGNTNTQWVIFDSKDFGKTIPYGEDPGSLTMNNCTVFDNSTVGISNYMGMLMTNCCTVTGNGIGIEIYQGIASLSNIISVGNKKWNLVSNKTSSCNQDKQSLIGGTAMAAGLDPQGLRDNGGPTPTVALVEKSVAIGAAKDALPTDQRGRARSRKSADLGAFEFQPVTPSFSSDGF